MSYEHKSGSPVSDQMVQNYLSQLVNKIFKILPIREQEDGTLETYLKSLNIELLGCKEVVDALQSDAMYLSIISIVQYFIKDPWADIPDVRREVFKAISLCKDLSRKYGAKEDL